MAAYKKSAEMRKSIMETTRQAVLTSGYKNVSIKEIADRLQIPRSLIYYYFSNKDEIMHALYNEYYYCIDRYAMQVLPENANPLVRLMFKFVVFQRQIVDNPLFSEYLVQHPSYSTMNTAEAIQNQEEYYADSRLAFEYFGMPTDDNRFQLHVVMVEAVAQALRQARAGKLLNLSEREMLEQFGRYTLMVSFGLSEEAFMNILDEAFALAERVKTVE